MMRKAKKSREKQQRRTAEKNSREKQKRTTEKKNREEQQRKTTEKIQRKMKRNGKEQLWITRKLISREKDIRSFV